jgi:hypothetical protein
VLSDGPPGNRVQAEGSLGLIGALLGAALGVAKHRGGGVGRERLRGTGDLICVRFGLGGCRGLAGFGLVCVDLFGVGLLGVGLVDFVCLVGVGLVDFVCLDGVGLVDFVGLVGLGLVCFSLFSVCLDALLLGVKNHHGIVLRLDVGGRGTRPVLLMLVNDLAHPGGHIRSLVKTVPEEGQHSDPEHQVSGRHHTKDVDDQGGKVVPLGVDGGNGECHDQGGHVVHGRQGDHGVDKDCSAGHDRGGDAVGDGDGHCLFWGCCLGSGLGLVWVGFWFGLVWGWFLYTRFFF